MSRAIYWRCFHCGDAFTKAQENHARDHFGRDQGETPVCLIREPGEYHVLRALRDAQDELASYRVEDTELWRALHSMSSDHRQALIREEEKGYAKGVADARAEGAEVLAALLETWRVLRAAGTLNLSNGVQLGQTSWYVKICDAEAQSDAALAKVGQPS
jgi:hypothetical protein